MILALALAAALSGAPAADRGGACYNLPMDARYDVMNDRVILISAGIRAYRVTVTPNSALALPSTNLVVERAGVVCSPIELQLSAAGPSVGRTGLIVQSITPLSREEAEDLRKGQSRASLFRNGG